MGTIPVIQQLATTFEYPAGGSAWSGQPTKALPSQDYATPGTKPLAEWINFWNNLLSVSIKVALDFAVASLIERWDPEIFTSSIPVPSDTTLVHLTPPTVFDPITGCWFFTGFNSQNASGETMLLATQDCGRSWTSSGQSGGGGSGGGGPGGGGTTVAIATDGAGHLLQVTDSTMSFWPTALVTLNAGPAFNYVLSSGSRTCGTAFWLNGASLFVQISGELSGTTLTGESQKAIADGSASPVSLTSSLPSGWATATNHGPHMWSAVRSDGNLALVAVSGTTADTSRLMTVNTSITMTDLGTLPPCGVGISIVGVAYSASDGLWGVLSFSGTASTLWTSPDLVTWTAAGVWTSTTSATGLAVVGSVWAVAIPVVDNATHAKPSPRTIRVVISSDVARLGISATWHATQGAFDFSGAPRLVTDGNQIVAIDSGGNVLAFSGAAGLR